MINSARVSIIAAISVTVGLLVGVAIAFMFAHERTDVNREDIEHIQVLALREMRTTCKAKHDVADCNGVLLYDFYRLMDPEAVNPTDEDAEGYVFVFANNFKKDGITLAYEVKIKVDGRIEYVKQIAKSDVNEIPE